MFVEHQSTSEDKDIVVQCYRQEQFCLFFKLGIYGFGRR